MKCPECQFDNREGIKFCEGCGAKMELNCPNCGVKIPMDRRFCGECGHNLSTQAEPSPQEISFDEKLDKIQRILPNGLTEKIIAQRGKIEGERKQVTVMFCDLVGYTSLSERLDSEETYQLMDTVYELLIHEVHRYQGTVNEMTGDGVLALFGAPIALEDAPQRAIRSAISIQRAIARKAVERRMDLKMRIGIHTGTAVVGTLGNDLRVEFKAVGDTVNLAARIEQMAEPGSILITENTLRLVEGLFRCEALGRVNIRGKGEPVSVYRVLGSGKSRSRFETRAEKGLTRFVGRERELEILRDCFERVREGKGQALSIVAEAGMGKSRLLYEFRKSLANEEVTFIEGQCVSYGQNIPYLPLVDILKNNFRIEFDDGPVDIQEKLKTGLLQIDASLDQTIPYLSELFALENGLETLKDIDPEVKRRRTFEALTDISLRGSQARPLVMAYEDLHWIDKTSEESIAHLVEHIAGARLFLIFTSRSNYIPPWGGKSYYSQINLNRLSNRESLLMIASLLDAKDIEEDLAGVILEKVEGIPFFIEEFTRSLEESEAIIKADGRCRLKPDLAPVSIPETLHDLSMARVDKLPEIAKEILRIGSVIEREFSWALIKEVTGIPEMELISHISHLKDAELIIERGIFPQVRYIFQHAITRELLYDSFLAAKRREYHLAIGEAMERLYSDRLNEYSPMLAMHFGRGGDPERGYQYCHLAGDRAAASFANREAMDHFQEARRLIDEEGENREVKEKRLYSAIKSAEVMEGLGEFEPTLVLLEEALSGSTDLEDSPHYARAHYWMGNTLGNLGRYEEARTYLLRSLELSQKSESRETTGDAHNYLSQLDYMQGYLQRALDHAEASVRCLREVGNPTRLAWALVFQGLVLASLKREDDYREFMEEVTVWVERSRNDRVRCIYNFFNIVNFYRNGQYEALMKSALESLELAERIGEGIQMVNCLTYAGLGAFYSGETDHALDLLQRGESEGERVGHRLVLASLRVALAEVMLRLGRIEESVKPVEAALQVCQELDLGYTHQWALEINAEILANMDTMDETRIDRMMEQADGLVERSGSPWQKIRHLLARARVSMMRGRLDDAREGLTSARSIYREMGLEEGTKELKSLEEALGKQEVERR